MTRFPIYTHLGLEILPTGSILNEKTISTLISIDFDRRVESYGYSEVFQKDMQTVFDKPAYEIIFRDIKTRNIIFKHLSEIALPNGTIGAIEYFKERNFYTYEHLLAVYALSIRIFSMLFPKESVSSFDLLLHDIGKCSLPIGLLQKETPLTFSERNHIQHHVLAGYALINFFSGKNNTNKAATIARDHHENMIGTGYPAGLQLHDIKTEIVIACDTYDALLSPREYRKEAFDNRTALEELTLKSADGLISELVVKAIVACNRKLENSWNTCIVSKEKRGVPPIHNNYGVFVDENE